MIYLLDTNVVSELMRPTPDERVAEWLHKMDEDEACISVVTIGELRRGVNMLAAGRRRTALESWLHTDLQLRFEKRTIDVTRDIANAWGEVMAQARRSGFGLNTLDAYIAATVIVHSQTLVTRNTKDFARLNLALINPWTS